MGAQLAWSAKKGSGNATAAASPTWLRSAVHLHSRLHQADAARDLQSNGEASRRLCTHRIPGPIALMLPDCGWVDLSCHQCMDHQHIVGFCASAIFVLE